jgi:hemerythrin-like domain-containing protein
MREHGVLRRALIVYRESASRLRAGAASVPPEALEKTAKLFRSFGEDYHERKLEEAFIFPAVKKLGGAAATYPDVLTAQHARGREITDYVLAVTQGAKLGAGAAALAAVLDAFVRMYESHMAIEDTIVFPAWKRTMTLAEYDEIGDKFEDIEHDSFGKDGFEDAVEQIAKVESALGLADLAKVTAPLPPPR